MLIEILGKIDTLFYPFFSFFNFLPSWLVSFLSLIGNIKLILILFLLLSLKRLRNSKSLDSRAHYRFFSLGLLFTILYILKISIVRVRPEFAHLSLQPITLLDHMLKNEFHSFPSSHAAVASFFLLNFRKSLILKTIAFLMCLSRVTSMQHYPTDVIAGLVIGCSIYFVGNKLYEEILQKIKKGKFITYP